MAYLAAPLLSTTADAPHSGAELVGVILPAVLVYSTVVLPAPALTVTGGGGGDETHGYAS